MSPAEYDSLLFAAHAQALAKLSELLLTTEDPREIRLIATSLLRIRPMASAAANPPKPAATSTPTQTRSNDAPPPQVPPSANAPLSPAELAELAAYLPHVPPARFTRKHTPAYWREALALQRRRASSSAAA